MGCGCSQADGEAERRQGEVLEHAGLREIVEQGHSALEEGAKALGHLARAERAQTLGFGDDVARMHRDAAVRGNRRAGQQLGFLIERIDARRNADDWPGLVKHTEASFGEHQGKERLDDARADFKVRLLEEDPGMSAAVAEQALALFDHMTKRTQRGDLNAVLDLMRETCEVAQAGMASDEMGRQPAPQVAHLFPGGATGAAGGQNVNGWCVALAACEAWAISSFIASTIICMAVPFCWCCFYPILMAAFFGHHLTCLAVFAPGCSAGKG
jgi:hypothetical protein